MNTKDWDRVWKICCSSHRRCRLVVGKLWKGFPVTFVLRVSFIEESESFLCAT